MSDDGLAMDLEYYAMLEAAANATHAAPPPAQVAIDPASPPRSVATGVVLEGMFKVGDRVKHREHGYDAHVVHLGTAKDRAV
jgi:sulfate adenylyltransferase subunit 1 (EFTu-like GTPase family)